MIRFGRQTNSVEHVAPSGATIRLTAETWWVFVAWGFGATAFTYHRPQRVEVAGSAVRIVDYTMLARLGLLAVLLLAALIGRSGNDR